MIATRQAARDSRTRTVPSAARAPQEGPRSLARVLGLFDAVAKSADGLTLAQLSATLGAPKSSLLMLLRPLAGANYLVHEGGRYRLGPAAFRLAGVIQSTRSLPRLMRPYLEELLAASGESVYLALLDPEAKLFEYVDGIESPKAVRYWVPIGTRRPLYTGSAGKLLLAGQPEEWRERYLRAETLKPAASRTITSKDALRRELETIRRDGYAVSRSEAVEGAAGISAPLRNQEDGSLAGALLIAAPEERFGRELPRLKKLLIEVAARASGKAG
jgi:IclR family acetate operon transcriptional repressor